jgi:DNA-binding MarR family transcriptional regulator
VDPLRNFGFLLGILGRKYVQRFEQNARELALTLPQCKVLVLLEKNQGLNQAKLAELADIEPMSMVRMLDRMESNGLLVRRADPGDRRARCLYLTSKAKPLLDEIWRFSDLTRSEIFLGIGRESRTALIQLMEKMHDNISCVVGIAPDGSAARTRVRAKASAVHKKSGRRRVRQ